MMIAPGMKPSGAINVMSLKSRPVSGFRIRTWEALRSGRKPLGGVHCSRRLRCGEQNLV